MSREFRFSCWPWRYIMGLGTRVSAAHTAAKCRDKNKWTHFILNYLKSYFFGLYATDLETVCDDVNSTRCPKMLALDRIGTAVRRSQFATHDKATTEIGLSLLCSLLFISMDKCKSHRRTAGMQQKFFSAYNFIMRIHIMIASHLFKSEIKIPADGRTNERKIFFLFSKHYCIIRSPLRTKFPSMKNGRWCAIRDRGPDTVKWQIFDSVWPPSCIIGSPRDYFSTMKITTEVDHPMTQDIIFFLRSFVGWHFGSVWMTRNHYMDPHAEKFFYYYKESFIVSLLGQSR